MSKHSIRCFQTLVRLCGSSGELKGLIETTIAAVIGGRIHDISCNKLQATMLGHVVDNTLPPKFAGIYVEPLKMNQPGNS